ncbi:hypothetical protein I4U23_010086 [Adineta vaga]|nr:hypothetical protein I4U23_010086 [Adineta vaga]
MSIRKNQFEFLANELFYEIFDYLSAKNLIKSFENLNKRFSLLLCQRLFQLDLSHLSKFQYEELIQTISTNQIYALKISNKWTINIFSRISFKSMTNLRILTLAHVNSHELRRLFDLKDFFLIIQQMNTFKIQSTNFNGLDRERLFVLQKIFTQMPKLRLCQLPLLDVNDFDDLNPSTSLETLVLDYCTMNCLGK